MDKVDPDGLVAILAVAKRSIALRHRPKNVDSGVLSNVRAIAPPNSRHGSVEAVRGR
ncbi:MAG: hypothetical protein ACOVPA_07935 [Rubrivivax sp.]|jgi:hypothetical protein|nr:hypothetical protein [Rubrivivax sp.]MCA3259232.1 hypothetical protein [Rubrivivax sp.]MCZ8029472.1 hypothetical protein [Rubrivivax sp.]